MGREFCHGCPITPCSSSTCTGTVPGCRQTCSKGSLVAKCSLCCGAASLHFRCYWWPPNVWGIGQEECNTHTQAPVSLTTSTRAVLHIILSSDFPVHMAVRYRACVQKKFLHSFGIVCRGAHDDGGSAFSSRTLFHLPVSPLPAVTTSYSGLVYSRALRRPGRALPPTWRRRTTLSPGGSRTPSGSACRCSACLPPAASTRSSLCSLSQVRSHLQHGTDCVFARLETCQRL